MARIGDRSEMEAFVRSVELGSFSAAASELGLKPSTLSKLVARLERSLAVKLLNRTTRRMSPTPEGELFVARCRRILAEMEDAETEVSRSRERPRGRLRMHVAVGFAMHQFAREMPRFLERHPEVQVDLVIEDRRVDIVKESLDISVRPWPPETTSLVVRKIFEFERVICASPAYLKRHGTPRTPEDLMRHRCMGVSSIPNYGQWLFQMPSGPRAIEVNLSASINNADLVYRFALAGQGVARLNEFIVAEAIRDGRLVQVLADHHCPEHLTMLAIYPQERHRLPRVAAMLDFLVEAFAGRPWRALRAKPRKKGPASRPLRKTAKAAVT
jgi:DNA-binding transcriptional LysR family regulator